MGTKTRLLEEVGATAKQSQIPDQTDIKPPTVMFDFLKKITRHVKTRKNHGLKRQSKHKNWAQI